MGSRRRYGPLIERQALALVLAVSASFVGLLGCTPHRETQSAADGKEEKTFTVTKKAYLHLREIRNALADEKYDDALGELGKMKERKFLNDHERALMWSLYGQTYASQGKLPDAANALEKALSLDALPDATVLDMKYNLGQLHLVNEDFDKAAKMMSEWIDVAENPKAEAYYIAATAYAQDDNFEEALPYAKHAVEKVEEPTEQWLQLLLSLHFELEHFPEVAAILKQLIEKFPEKKRYWVQLSAVYMELGDQPRAVAVLELAYRQQMLDEEDELLKLAKLYLNQGVPLKAARVVDEGVQADVIQRGADSMELLAKSWLHAREYDKALPILDEAASLADDGELYMQGARIMAQRGEWAKVRSAAKKALEKGIPKPGQAHLLIATATYNLGHRDAAQNAFFEAAKHEESKHAAKQWIALIEKERKQCEAGRGSNCPEGSAAALEEEAEAATAKTIEAPELDPKQQKLVGKYRYAGAPAQGRAIVRKAILKAIDYMSTAEKAIARRRLNQSNALTRSIAIAFPQGKIAITLDRFQFVSRPGRRKSITTPQGDPATVVQTMKGDKLDHTSTGDQGTLTNVFSASADGKRIVRSVTIRASQLKNPIRYTLPYEQK